MRKLFSVGLGTLFLLSSSLPATAQIALATPDIALELRQIGNSSGPTAQAPTNAIYERLFENLDREGVVVSADIEYGPHARNTLDLYTPEAAADGGPLVIFLHGGGFIQGDKSLMANVGYYFARNGVTAAVVNYQLAPDSVWPAAIEDIGLAITWVHENVSTHGADPDNIFLAGTSAGANNVGGYVFHDEFQVPDDGVQGAILLSIPAVNMDAETLNPTSGTAQYMGTDAGLLAERSLINHVEGRSIPLLLGVAEFDFAGIQDQVAQLFTALYERDERLPNLVTALGHNHYSISLHIGTDDENLGRHMLEFIAATSLAGESDI